MPLAEHLRSMVINWLAAKGVMKCPVCGDGLRGGVKMLYGLSVADADKGDALRSAVKTLALTCGRCGWRAAHQSGNRTITPASSIAADSDRKRSSLSPNCSASCRSMPVSVSPGQMQFTRIFCGP